MKAQANTRYHDLWGISADMVEAPITGVCEYHSDRRAQGRCTECQAYICIECLTSVEHLPVCPVCAGVTSTGELPPLTTEDVVLRFSGTLHPVAARTHLGRLLTHVGLASARG